MRKLKPITDLKAYKESQEKRRAKRLPVRTAEILALESWGYRVEQLTQWHFRITGKNEAIIDVWPLHNRWQNLRTGNRGGARSLAVFIKKTLKPI